MRTKHWQLPFLIGASLAGDARVASAAPQGAGATFEKPIVIAHRGASGYRPEHTIESYALGILMGADFIEPDLVPTSDGVLIARHENALATVALDAAGAILLDSNGRPIVTGQTTNVAELPQFAGRLTVKAIDGVLLGGWFSEDFTFAEIRTLRTRERIPGVRPANAAYNDQFLVPTIDDVILLVRVAELLTGREVGIYPETKHPTYFAQEGRRLNGQPIQISTSQLLVEALVRNGFTDPSRIFIQSFEFANLIELQTQLMPAAGIDVPLVQLYGDIEQCCLQPFDAFSRPYDMYYNALVGADLNAIYGPLAGVVQNGITTTTHYGDVLSQRALLTMRALYAEGIGPWKNSFLLRTALSAPVDGNGDGLAQITSGLTGRVHPFLSYAFQAGLKVHPYTLRAEEPFLTVHANGVPQAIAGEVAQLLSLGINGFFIDQPDLGVAGRDQFLALNGQSTARLAGGARAGLDYASLMRAYYEAASALDPASCR
ncbi:MAG: glycerophosphodiester phosphodiesterase family protein [Planctomycetota bacterium]